VTRGIRNYDEIIIFIGSLKNKIAIGKDRNRKRKGKQ